MVPFVREFAAHFVDTFLCLFHIFPVIHLPLPGDGSSAISFRNQFIRLRFQLPILNTSVNTVLVLAFSYRSLQTFPVPCGYTTLAEDSGLDGCGCMLFFFVRLRERENH